MLKEAWQNPRIGYSSFNRFWRKVKDAPQIQRLHRPYNFVKRWTQIQPGIQIMRPQGRHAIYRSIVAPGPGSNYQMDLLVLSQATPKANAEKKSILVVIDVTSRYLACRALRDDKLERIAREFEHICGTDFKRFGYPRDLTCDQQFAKKTSPNAPNNAFIRLCKTNEIKMWLSEAYESHKNALVERVIRTIRRGLAVIMQAKAISIQKAVRDHLADIVWNYNHSFHRTIKTTPADVWFGRDFSHQVMVDVWPGDQFQKGDRVRIAVNLLQKAQGRTKETTPRWSREIYTIKERVGRAKFLLSAPNGIDVVRLYKYDEISKVDLPPAYPPWNTRKIEQGEGQGESKEAPVVEEGEGKGNQQGKSSDSKGKEKEAEEEEEEERDPLLIDYPPTETAEELLQQLMNEERDTRGEQWDIRAWGEYIIAVAEREGGLLIAGQHIATDQLETFLNKQKGFRSLITGPVKK